VGARTKARRRAVEILYEAEARGLPATQTLAARLAAADPPLNPYVAELVEGVSTQRERIDELLATYSHGWTLDRMPAVDRNILRLGAYELLWCEGVPDEVALDEAVTLAHELSTDESPGFVNGLLGRLRELKPTLSV
jgi:transcription antitermination protein NusB